ncbi:rhodanese-like domain-containing protein [Marinifilum sp.]|uniref:rhodanese-like domain-containing protein n=1 Tax=Marinifilum sp. TaxID=2033137 RepID=UPI003BAC4684
MRITCLIILVVLLESCNYSNQKDEPKKKDSSINNEKLPEEYSQYRDITGLVEAAEFHQLIQTCDSVKIYDVRPREVFVSEPRIKGAKLIYDFSYFNEALKELHRDHQIMVYCGKELRSPAAVKSLVNLGFNNVYELKGGLTAWKSKKLPLVDNNGKNFKY